MFRIFAKFEAEFHAVLRIMAGLLILQHGTVKILSFPAKFSTTMTPLLQAAGMIELIGGFLFVIGFQTKYAAFLLAGFTATAYFMSHARNNFFPVLNGGSFAILFCFVFLYFTTTGAGKWSIDNRLQRPIA